VNDTSAKRPNTLLNLARFARWTPKAAPWVPVSITLGSRSYSIQENIIMYAFKVSLNKNEPVVAGAPDLGVLSAILTATGKLGPKSIPHREDETQDFTFQLGGLTSRAKGEADEHLVWLQVDELNVGDMVTIEIVETEKVHGIISGKEAEQREHDEREYFEHCKKAYFEMRGKYEDESNT
jgi:hypothetical protein